MRGMLFSQMEPPAGREGEFHAWYDEEHIPARMALPGFARATRYRAVEGEPSHLAVYELDDMGVLETPAYRELKDNPSPLTAEMLRSVTGFTRYIGEAVSDSGRREEHRFLSVVAFQVPDDEVAEFDQWYEVEHAPLLLEADDWLRVSRYRRLSGEGGPWTHFALHELRTLDVLESPQRRRAREAPRRQVLAARPWFAGSGRWVYEVIARAEGEREGREIEQ
jgi:hypothetical protein